MSAIVIQPTQPEASSSTPSLPKHIATFVFDSSLPRSRFKRLTVADGVVHKLVQRLMEKHGGETNLRLCLLITASSSSNEKRTKVYRREYSGPLAFLTSLPNLVEHFPKSGRQSSIQKKWPSFSGQNSEEGGKSELIVSKKRKTRDEITLLDGVVGGVETLNRPYVNIQHSPSRTFISLTPASATPLLDSLHTPISPVDTTPGSPARRYLVVVASNDTNPGYMKDRQDQVVSADDNWDSTWDDHGWHEVASGIKAKDMKCSCVVVGRTGDDETPSKKLKSMCKEVSNGSLDAPWFSVPQEVDVMLSGYSIETGSTPPLDMASTVATEPIETPISNPQLQIPMPSIQAGNTDGKTLQQLQNQAMQARMAQFAKAVSSVSSANGANVKIDPQMMASMVQAMKNPGNTPIDMSDPKWQQVRQLLQLQQQRQMAATSSNNNNNINNSASSANVMAAIQQQRAQQAQSLQQPQQQQVRPAQQQIWSGSLSSASQPGSYTHLLNLDASKFSGNTEGILAQHWPKDLQLRNVVVLEVQTLTAYAQAKSCPIVVFTPSITMGQDSAANSYKYTQLANSLHAKGNMVIIPFGTQDRGIVLFSASMPVQPPTPSGSRQYHLMGVVCLHVPFPPLNAATVRTTPNQIPQQAQLQPEQQIPQARQQQQQQQVPVPVPQQQPQQQQQYRPSPNAQNQNVQNAMPNNNTNNNNNNNTMYHQQMLLQAQSAMQSQGQGQTQPQPQQMQNTQQLQQFLPQQQQQQQQFIPQQQQQQEKKGITQQQYTQLMLHAQRLGLPIQQHQFEYNNLTSNQVQMIVNGIKMAEAKLRQQAQQAQAQQNMQQQQAQQNMQMQQQQQQQMAQLQQMLASQGQFAAMGDVQGQGQGYPQ
uniref:Mediator of RNA polymerase II transcription subunit 25 n=1 Tax=Kwoniella bestiolae CBS 10118 TaxID=1296100 RepID=A0A1B9G095_9TREE|nr:hypothetical protein I302_05901 [Kwoniella bestiolae CBS 10118]OCF24441.1 hypothetical protein I302_05901 [Kwoniella bestiolae CBS 10118]